MRDNKDPQIEAYTLVGDFDFVTNLTNQEAATSVSTTPGPVHDGADYVTRARTAGLELHYSFKDR